MAGTDEDGVEDRKDGEVYEWQQKGHRNTDEAGKSTSTHKALSNGIWITIHYICILIFLICQLTAVKSAGKVCIITVFSRNTFEKNIKLSSSPKSLVHKLRL